MPAMVSIERLGKIVDETELVSNALAIGVTSNTTIHAATIRGGKFIQNTSNTIDAQRQ